MIDLTGVSKIFRTDIVETYALMEFNLHIRAGEFVAITGHSGSGKTNNVEAPLHYRRMPAAERRKRVMPSFG